ncbi:MAG: sulfite exporter TauE/SafE family protein [Chloroflexi bacterium]|nr:sulfite exporter TauE/SafE family protein [Chloroflexota bacterium]MCI0643296.1 sulfite exporter TauE/SafE family protein [Chloroflexota bacterium]MCI0725784.1 sulfite exporter TauE/SafE family protein [Chloroflexota bacterium]
MTNLAVVFLTGLTTGGLSCLAVQGGLLASSVAHHAEQSIQQHLLTPAVPRLTTSRRKSRRRAERQRARLLAQARRASIRPVLLFLVAKLVTYAILGFLLGWLGGVLQLTPATRAALQLAVGVFMVGTALRMLNVHPIFRYFALEPPAFVTRAIRRTAKNSADAALTPIFLGFLTILIPCGVTQVMMAAAIASANPVEGAAILSAFTLGTSPLFFSLAYLATQVGKKLEARFVQAAAVTVLVLGFVAINAGLNLLGSPVSFSRLTALLTGSSGQATQSALDSSIAAPPSLNSSTTTADPSSSSQSLFAGQSGPMSVDPSLTAGSVMTITVGDYGYEPGVLRAPAGQAIQLKLVTQNSYSCGRIFVIPALNFETVLPETGVTPIDIPSQKAGTTLYFTCSMGMFGGVIQF